MAQNLKQQFLTTFIAGAVLLFGIAVVINMIADNAHIGRFDLTADQVYKLSPSVKKILADLEAPIELTYYVSSSEKMPTQWKNLERDVIDKLEELKLASAGKLTYKVFDPSAEEEKEAMQQPAEGEPAPDLVRNTDRPNTDRKKIAQRLYEKGVIPFGVQSTSQDEFAIKRVYSSIVLSYLDRKEDVIQEVRPESFGNLEYEIMSRIYKLISNRRPRIGFYPAQPEIPPQYRQYYRQGPPPDMYEYTVELLREAGYDVQRTNITADDPVPEDIQTMVLMVDQQLSQRQLFEISRLAHQGVRIVLAAQQNNYQISAGGEPGSFMLRGMPARLNINSITGDWGFEFDPAMFMDKSSAYIQIPVYQTRDMGLFSVRQQRMEPVTKPVIIKVNPENINTDLSISNKISELFYLYGGRIILNRDAASADSIALRTLFTSSNYSWTTQGSPYGPINENPPPDSEILRHQIFGLIAEGTFPSSFAGQVIPQWPPDPESGEQPAQADSSVWNPGSPVENKMLAFGCTNMFKSDVLQSVTSHKALLLNAVDALTLGDELINIRSKNIHARRIREISSFGKALSKGFVVWLMPAVFVVLGIFFTIRRRMGHHNR
ncbi:GldG family protein [bacterium]|nr:GldG family protein [bacterium]